MPAQVPINASLLGIAEFLGRVAVGEDSAGFLGSRVVLKSGRNCLPAFL